MHRTAVRADGTLPLGPDAARLGFVPGALVDVIVTSAGSLILALSDEPAVDVPYRRLTPAMERRMIGRGRTA